MKLLMIGVGLSLPAFCYGQTYTIKVSDAGQLVTQTITKPVAKPMTDDELNQSINDMVKPPSEFVYAYHKGDKPLSTQNYDTTQVQMFGKTVELPVSKPTNAEVTAISNDDELNATLDSPDKRWLIYHEWEYLKIDNEFDDKAFKMARLLSNDGHAILFIAYDVKDKQYKNPNVGLQLSGKLDNGNWHNFLCMQNCLNIDFNIDGKKYPNISMKYGGGYLLLAKQPKTLLNHLKDGDTIKIRMTSITGEALVYVFEPEQRLSLSQLKTVK